MTTHPWPDWYTRRVGRAHFRGLAPPHGFTSNGCTCAPDFATNGANLGEACRWHDYAYSIPGNEAYRRTVDRNFRHNLIVSGCPSWLAGIYYRRVRFWGVMFFEYAHGCRPGWRHWLATFFRRYRSHA